MAAALVLPAQADTDVHLLDVPDYEWFTGCMGTTAGNLMGFWDRHGFPDFYTGPTDGGVAPLRSEIRRGIRAMWATQAGLDGRPLNQPGHIDDYGNIYESTAPDPYVVAGRVEHPPDSINDFTGQSQKRWTNMNNECDGNIDAYSFVYWDTAGDRRWNFVPGPEAGQPARDVPSGLRAWTRWRGYDCDVFSQLTDFNPRVPPGKGFSYENLKAEIDAGYPVILFLQNFSQMSRSLPGPPAMPRANPPIHSMLACGYVSYPEIGVVKGVKYRTSWASGDDVISEWNTGIWQANLPLRGVIGFRPKPKVRKVLNSDGNITLQWDGPAAQRYDRLAGTIRDLHYYVIEKSQSFDFPNFVAVTTPATNRVATLPTSGEAGFFRVRLVPPP